MTSAIWEKVRSIVALVWSTRDVEMTSDVSHDVYAFPRADGLALLGHHFLMGAEKFDIVPTDNVLFGENADVNAIGPRAAHFPFELTQNTEPLRPLQCLINVRRDSVRFIKHEDGTSYCVQFTVDADVACEWRVFYHGRVTETFSVGDSTTVVGPVDLEVGASIKCTTSQCPFVHDATITDDDTPLQYPVIIELVTTSTSTVSQSQLTMCSVSATTDQTGCVLKPVRQKLLADGILYLLHDVYGIENKHASRETVPDAETSADVPDNSMDCVICMSELRDTLIIPCRHLCLCSACAETLRFKLSNCPICRSPFRALLHMRTLRKVKSTVSAPNLAASLLKMATPTKTTDGAASNTKSFLTTRYDFVPLVVALNGAVDQTHTIVTSVPTASLSGQSRRQAARRRAEAIEHVMGEPIATVVVDEVAVAEYANGLEVVDDGDDSDDDDECDGSVGRDSDDDGSLSSLSDASIEESPPMEETSTPRSGQSADSVTTLIKKAGDAVVTQETEC